MKPYLIQRARFENRDFKTGIDSIIKLDYMGSSEFENGAVPKSLKKIRDNKKEYVFIKFNIQKKDIIIYCKESEISDVKKYLLELSRGNHKLKEYCDFKEYINPSKFDLEIQAGYGHKTDFWWDIENHIMFWKQNTEFKMKFKNHI